MKDNENLNFYSYLEGLSAEWQHSFTDLTVGQTISAGENVCRQSDPSDAVFVIVEGTAEVLLVSEDHTRQRRVGYLTRGDIIGELGLLNGEPRSATVRAKTDVVVRAMARQQFFELLEDLPGFGGFIARMLASRFKILNAEVKYQSHCLHLRGNLPLFDLLMVFQTIRDSNAQGELLIWNSENEPCANLFFRGSLIHSAKFAHLTGYEAIYQALADNASQGTFAFQMMANPLSDAAPECIVDAVLTDVLMQGAMKRDYFQQLPEPLRSLRGRVERRAPLLTWSDPETQHVATTIWRGIQEGRPELPALWKTVPASVLTFSQVLLELARTGQLEIELDPLPEEVAAEADVPTEAVVGEAPVEVATVESVLGEVAT